MEKPKTVAVVGTTASGKSALAIDIAKRFNGEVLSADSRQVYRGLDLGTAKVTPEEMDGVRHHLLDIADPAQVYTAAEYEVDATAAMLEIRHQGHLPIIAGGTFFYLDLLRGKQSPAPVEPNEEFRISLSQYTTPELFARLQHEDPRRANTIDSQNRHRLIRALEIIQALGHVPRPKKNESPYDWLIIGLDIDKLRLYQNIHTRLCERLDAGMLAEAEGLYRAGLSLERMCELGLEYRYMAKHLARELNHDEMVTQIELKTRKYAKRQMTWLKRDKEIEWFKPEDRTRIFHRVEHFLYGEQS